MNVDSLEAGRELDALVAERVMGLNSVAAHRQGFDGRSGWHDDYGHGSGYVRNPPQWPSTPKFPEDYNFERVPFYSTDIAAAWEVFEKIPGIGEYGVAIEREPDGTYAVIRQDSVYMYISGGGGAPEFETLAQGDTAPLAICRAALRAAGA